MKNYTKEIIDFYDKNVVSCVKSGAVVLKSKANEFTRLIKGPKILDVGCGPGHDTDYLTRRRFDCLGIDLSKEMIKYAKKNFKGKFRIMDFFNLDFKKNTFDGIWCSSAISHVAKRDLDKILKSFLKILKEDGVLGIIVPQTKKWYRKKNGNRVFTTFYEYEIKKYLIKSRFKILSTEIFPFANRTWIFVIAKKQGE